VGCFDSFERSLLPLCWHAGAQMAAEAAMVKAAQRDTLPAAGLFLRWLRRVI